jgi:ech hydrogenase subunit A
MILGPIATGAGLLWLKPDQFRKILVGGITLLVCGCVLALATIPLPLPVASEAGLLLDHHWLSTAMMVIEGGMGLYVVYVGLRARHPLIVALMLAQAGLMAWLELAHGSNLEAANNFLVDKFSVIMALINGVVGGGICLYALGYMRSPIVRWLTGARCSSRCCSSSWERCSGSSSATTCCGYSYSGKSRRSARFC